MARRFTVLCLAAMAVAITQDSAVSRSLPQSRGDGPRHALGASASPYTTNRTHRIGNVAFTATNWGFFGSETRTQTDPCTGRPAESFEFPRGSAIEYLYQGAMWVGAVKGRDTLVSVGADGWYDVHEFFPLPYPEGDIVERTIRPTLRASANSRCGDVEFSQAAVSEQDFVAVYYDTVTNIQFVDQDPIDGRPHIPIGLEIRQESYAWSFDYAEDFILMHIDLRNISRDVIRDLYMGLYMDHDVHHVNLGLEGYQDDITGFTPTVPSVAGAGFLDTINIAWIADNDGDPAGGRYGLASPTGVVGVRVVQAPTSDLQFAFNWWISNQTAAQDWGPRKRSNPIDFVSGNLGTPEGDRAKYQVLSNGEFDYDQIESAIDHQVDGWMPPVANPVLAEDLADGFDTRYLLSFGPFNVVPDSTLPLTIALIAGADFHEDPQNFQTFFDPGRPDQYLERLDLTDFARNAQWAGWVYDTPGFDTDGNGTRGSYRIVGDDTIYYSGDGVPDFQGPPPPPAPELRFKTMQRKIVMRWNGERSETELDVFSNLADFEGYRVYLSRPGQLADFALLTQRDHVNWLRRRYSSGTQRWVVKDPPFDLDSLQALYQALVDTAVFTSHWNPRPGTPFHPDSFKIAEVNRALREVRLDPIDPSKLDTNYYYFQRYGSNEMADDVGLANLVDHMNYGSGGGSGERGGNAPHYDTLWEHGEPYDKSYEYEYAVDGLQLAEPVFLAVTTFDFGNPAPGLSSLESSPLATMEQVWPINSADIVESNQPKPGVYPNPYRLADDYNASGWEDPTRQGTDPERSRKVTFTNVPSTCTVSIWTLDGDLVRKLDHDAHPLSSDATVVVWDLITRNTQAVKTGIYIYTVESEFGTDVGKLVIVK